MPLRYLNSESSYGLDDDGLVVEAGDVASAARCAAEAIFKDCELARCSVLRLTVTASGDPKIHDGPDIKTTQLFRPNVDFRLAGTASRGLRLSVHVGKAY